MLDKAKITRAELVQRLAEISHRSWMVQTHRAKRTPWAEIPCEVSNHDRERAEDVVEELERLGIFAEE